MSKTFKRIKGSRKPNGERNYERRVAQPEIITVEWAHKVTKPRIAYAVRNLASNGHIKPFETEDYELLFRDRVSDAVEKYDPYRRDEFGRQASALNYCISAVDNFMLSVIAWSKMKLRCGHETPISTLPPEEANESGCISVEDELFSDRCRSVKAIDFRMDAETYFGMLSGVELEVVKLRLAGFTISDVCRQLGLTRMHVVRKLVPSIQRKARICGFDGSGRKGFGDD